MHNTMKNNTQKVQKNKGISLVISLIMMTLLLAISFSIGNIILRQLRLTNIGTNSQTSFYAADSAIECALYWDTLTDGTVSGDINSAIFGTTTTYTSIPNPIICGPNTSNPLEFIKNVDTVNDIATSTFVIDYGQNTCAKVEVVKSPYRTKISTSGYNTGITGTSCALSNTLLDRVVERGLIFAH